VCGETASQASGKNNSKKRKIDQQQAKSTATQVTGKGGKRSSATASATASASASSEKVSGFQVLSGPMKIFLHKETMDVVQKTFEYLTVPPEYLHREMGLLARRVALLDFQIIEQNAQFKIGDLNVRSFPVWHGGTYVSLGFSIGKEGQFVYISDVKIIPEPTMQYLRSIPQIDTLVIDALKYEGIWPHMGLEEALAVVAELRPKRAFFTGMSCEIGDHDVVEADLAKRAPHTHLAYDGLVLEDYDL
jgi:phosphoribosyl 1,2-cyclic phosphate phosphodiesterase